LDVYFASLLQHVGPPPLCREDEAPRLSDNLGMAGCGRCGAEISPDARFCPECGAPVTAEPTEERKVATVLFADLVGSTELAGSQDPERTRAMLDRFYDAMAEEIERGGGTVEKFAGDAVMAAFGAPRALEDHAERALHVALAMRRRLAELFGGQLELRIGINTGDVVVGQARAGSSFVSGDTVNVAARLEQAADSGDILAGERTVAAARGAFEFDQRMVVAAKGKPEGVAAQRVVRALSLMRPRGLRGLAHAFVGRDRELERLRAAYRMVVEQRRPGLVTILGDAGVGKTRLARELWQRLPEENPEPLRRTGRCLSYGTGTAYWALGEVLKEHLGLLESDAPDVALERLGARQILGLTLGLDVARDLHPLAARDRFQDAWAEFLTDVVAERPAVVLVEDVHWAEAQLLDLLEYVLGSAQGPLLLVATARPELLQRRPGWGARAGRESIELEPLSPQDAVRLVHELFVGRLPTELSELVVERAEGNPFFVEELLGVLIDRGLLARENGGWVMRELPDEFVVPDSVHAVLAARIDLLGAAEKSALQAAAVVGRVFWAGPVYELVEATPDLRVLEERDFIRRRAGSSMAGEREYAIKHALTREVAYASLPRARRLRMHAAFAAWLERMAPGRDDLASLLAHHFAEAVRPEDADLAWQDEQEELQRLRERALQWLERAAQFALRRYEIEDAVALLERALSLEPDEESQARVWRAIGKANALKFDGEAFWTAMQSSLRVCSNKATCADTYSELAFQTAIRSAMWAKRPDRELVGGWIEQALELSEPESNSRAKALIARSFWDRNTPEAAREGRELAERLSDIELRSYAWGACGAVAFGAGDFDSALEWSQRRLSILDEISDPDHVADIYEIAIPSYCATAHFSEARRLAAENAAVVEPLSSHHRVHGIALQLEVEEACGGWDRIVDLAEQTEAAVTANLATPCIRNARSLLLTALAAAYSGDNEAARRYERRADEITPEGYDFVLAAPRMWLALLRGEIDTLERVESLDVARGQTWYALPATAARLDALAALKERPLVERDAPALLQPGTYLEPFALRALGTVRDDEALLEQAIARFQAIGLHWHAEQTWKLVAPT
jgi:class 3 adenylate cyclase/tetratricopeptide (TPR) repeat protein